MASRSRAGERTPRQAARALGVSVSQRRGQNFLRDPSVSERVVEFSEVGSDDVVLEIGPGLGALTSLLSERVKRLLVVEVEPALASKLSSDLCADFCSVDAVSGIEMSDRTTVISGDFCKLDLEMLASKVGPFHVVSNLPYSISSEVCLMLFSSWRFVRTATLMLQREFAERLSAPPGGRDYGSISVRREVFCDIKRGFAVPPECFSPRPKVESMVVKLAFLAEPRLAETERDAVERLVRTAFQKRRKTIANAIDGVFGLSKAEISERVSRGGFNLNRRPETFSLDEFAVLTRLLCA